ncbi:MAG: aldehyde dehydrogenase [Aestuariivirga sp.]|uniref:aldehyde dehydrogenase n=1 Tax=Aestuariivirga sp. TaxID=2650926 RepID=UPI0025C61D9C|nr:aldehyde dehydrogenase [Aestuariivirga sp.]MCA3560991.1 aldehyde dehydrogenase [Aestuariivirga sp.]
MPVDYRAMIPSLSFRNQAFINGKYVSAASGRTFDCISPIDGRVLTQVAECDAEDVNRAVTAARAVFEKGSWSACHPGKRKKVMLKFAELMAKHKDELALLETLDMGKPISTSAGGDIPGSIQAIQWYAEAADKVYDEIAPYRPDSVSLITREPIGVVAAVVPWNYPLMMASWKLGPALATGNSIILKPAEQSPLTAIRIAELAAEAGIPDGVLQVLPGFGETAGQWLGRHMDVDMVAFTGSTEVGKYFLRYAGESNMKHVSLETGGKSPNIVFADAGNLDHIAKTSADGVFYNSGQSCNAPTRILVEDRIKDEFVALLTKHAKPWTPADPLDPNTSMGAIVDTGQMNRVLGYIEAGRTEGATVALGGAQARKDTGGAYIEPTVFTDVRNEMKIAQEEIFGPVAVAIAFKDEDEAVGIANESIYGLQANLWTRDVSRAHRLSRRLKAGTVVVNNVWGSDITNPFGGYKQSGIGRDKSLHAMDKYCQVKNTYIQL